MLGTTVTPQASPEISRPLLRLPEITLVWTVWLPPVEVIRMPLLPLAAMPAKASMPAKVLSVLKPLAVSATSMPLLALPPITLPSGMTPPTWVLRDEPSISTPSCRWRRSLALSAPTPAKLARIVTWSELVTWMPLPPLPLTTL